MGLLLEREQELGAVAAAYDRLGAAAGGDGGVVLVEGPAGIGKTALLDHACRLAGEVGIPVRRAGGGELEQDFPYGVVRTLFDDSWPLSGHESSKSGEVLHGLFRRAVDLAREGPLVLVVDDLHWADEPSLRFLLYLARRLGGGIPVLVLAAARPEDADDSLLARLAAEPSCTLVRPGGLSVAGVRALLQEAFTAEPPPHDRFVAACHAATGGVPFLVQALAAALAAEGVRPDAGSADQVRDFGPAAVADATLLRLARLPESAAQLARAVAVLGPDARLDRAARLAAIPRAPDAVEAVDALTARQILAPGRPLAFVHPIVRTAIHEAMPAAARAAAHARAAELVPDTAVDAVAGHLLAAEPAGSFLVVDRLRTAARHAQDRGAPASAVAYLRRALDEAAPECSRAELVHELAVAEKLARDPRAIARLIEARDLAADPVTKAEIGCELSEALAATGRWQPAMEALDAATADLSGKDDVVALRIQTQHASGAAWDPRRVADFDAALPELTAVAARAGPPARRLALILAAVASMRGDADEQVERFVTLGLDGGGFLDEEGPDAPAVQLAGSAYVNSERLDAAARLAQEVVGSAQQRGSAYGFVNGVLLRARVHTRRGDLAATEADLRSALEVAQEHDLVLGVSSILLYGADALAERHELADLLALARGLPLPAEMAETPIGMVLAGARGRARLAGGDLAGAAEDLGVVGRIAAAVRFRNPNALSWRSPLALALAPLDRAAALALVVEELAEARAVGRPRAIGVACRTLGVVDDRDAGLDRLREAVAVLAESPAQLEHARALVELGARLRRTNQRTAARDPLRRGLDLAHRLGATRLADRAGTELAAAGARPRRRAIAGAEALTPSERRVADMAASGMSNPEIAHALFVSINTVETHLRHVYRKLQINRRTSLPEALTD